jgi:hypothetical protein
VRDFVIEKIKAWFFSLDSCKNLISHPLESLILFLLTILIDLSVDFLARIFTLVKEGSKILLKGFSPQEFKILVLMDKMLCGIFNLIQIICQYLKRAKKLELILDFNQVITVTSIKTWHLNSQRDEIISYFQNDISDTISS